MVVERLNLTIRQGVAYLFRRTICYARWKEYLEDQLSLLRCYCSFVVPYLALKFGRKVRTLARQAGLATRRPTLREIFSLTMALLVLQNVAFVFVDWAVTVSVATMRMPMAA